MNTLRERIKTRINLLKPPHYGIAAFLVTIWLVGFFVFELRGLIHVLLIITLMLVLVKLIQARNSVAKNNGLNDDKNQVN